MMTLFINHCWCSMNHRDGKNFDCSSILDICKHPNGFDDDVWEQMDHINRDWITLVHKVDHISTLKPEVVEYLDQKFGDKWCMGNNEYRENNCSSINLFFVNPEDAKEFAKSHSMFKGVVEIVDRFDDIKYVLKDKNLVQVEDWDEEFQPTSDSYLKKSEL